MLAVDVIVVGGGQSGSQLAISLRELGFTGSILIITKETYHPYERPPLSKDYLSGDGNLEWLYYRDVDFWDEKKISFLFDKSVTEIVPNEKKVVLDSGEAFGYSNLVWAAGGEPRRIQIPGSELAGIHYLRTVEDANGLVKEAKQAKRAVIVGGGFIGLEVASALTKLGVRVIVVEALDRLLARVTVKEVSDYYEREHLSHGTDIRFEQSVVGFQGEAGQVNGVELATGELLPAEIIVVGIGLIPNVTPLQEAGALVENGVNIDGLGKTSLPDIYALGDCANFENKYTHNNRVRLESVQNAVDRAKSIARSIMHLPVGNEAVPWFWSTQYDEKFKTVGIQHAHDEYLVRGSLADGKFSIVYLREGRVIAVDTVNNMKDYAQAKLIIADGRVFDKKSLNDISVSFKELLASESSNV